MRLVDADRLLKTKFRFMDSYGFRTGIYVVEAKAINDAPTVDAGPAVHGHWTWFEEISPSNTDHYEEIEDCGWKCSCCNGTLEEIVGGYWDDIDDAPKLNYCPNCGAKMDGKVEYNERAHKS